MQLGDVVELTIDSLELEGRGVARPADGPVVFVTRGLPGQRVRALVTTRKERHAEAEVVDVLAPAPDQVPAPCPHFGVCGGCTWQELDYASQLRWKTRLVAETLSRLGGAPGKAAAATVADTIPSPRQYRYRNKMEFAFAPSDEPGAVLRLGLRHRGGHEVVDVTDCRLMVPEAMAVLEHIRHWTRKSGLPAWDADTREGCWRFCVLRLAEAHGDTPMQILVHVITGPDPEADLAAGELARSLKHAFPQVAVLAHSVRAAASNLAQGQELRRHHGPLRLPLALGELVFHVSPEGFFQTNGPAAALLYDVVKDMADLHGTETVRDLYCGSGGIALWLADKAAAVQGLDSSREAVRDAVKNEELNRHRLGAAKVEFATADLGQPSKGSRATPEVVVVDPPRGGLDKAVREWLLEKRPARLVAVSCNPATLARDIQALGGVYDVERVQPVDMFPQTPHVEVAALLVRRE